MVSGLEEELKARMSGNTVVGQSSNKAPSSATVDSVFSALDMPISPKI